jgi:hypothetical protein
MGNEAGTCQQCGNVLQPYEAFCANCGMQQDVPAGNPFFQQGGAPGSVPGGPPLYPPAATAPHPYAQPGLGPPLGTGSAYGPPTYGAMPGYPGAIRGSGGTNGYAIASLVLSLLVFCGIGSVLAVIFGGKARREIRESRGAQTGDGLALAGIIIGYIGIALVILWIFAIFFLGHTEPGRFSSVNYGS